MTETERKLPIVQIGIGGWGRTWAGVLRSHEDCTLAGVVDPDPGARAWAQEELGLDASRCVASLDEALERLDFVGAVVVTPPRTHEAVATAALEAGKHVLVEKPLADTVDAAQRLVDAAARADRALVVSQNYRYRPPARTVKSVIADGALGGLHAIRGRFRRDTRALFPPGDFRYSMRHPYVVDMAIHHFDLLRSITQRDVIRLDARSWPVPDSPYEHHPAVAVLMTLEGNVAVSYEGDWAPHDPDTTWDGDWELIGERGRLLWITAADDVNRATISLERWGEPAEQIAPIGMERINREATLAAFCTAVATGEPAETSGADNLNSLAAVFGCVESLERDTAVDVRQLSRAGSAASRD